MKKTSTFLSILSILSLITLQPVFGQTDQSTSTISDSAPSQTVEASTTNEQPKASVESSFDQPFRSTVDGSELVPQNTANTKTTFVNAPLMDIAWCGEKNNVIFMLTEKNTLYRSQDDGFTGHLLDEHLQKLGKAELLGPDDEVGEVSRIMQSPVDKNVLLIVGTRGINWVTENCGASFKALNQGRPVEEFQFHPTERTWLLASAWTVSEDFDEEPYSSYKELFLSKDLGDNWDYVANYVFQSAWGMVDKTFTKTPKERIIVSYNPKAKGNQTLSGSRSDIQVSYSDDFFKTAVRLMDNSDRFLLSGNFLFIVQGQGKDKQGLTLYSADSRQKEYVLKEIETPASKILDRSYTLLETAEHSVFLHIDHQGSKASYGNIYVSDSTGVRFSLALENHVRSIEGQCDFEKVEGLEGIYLANVYDKDAVKKFKKLESDQGAIQAGSNKKFNKKAVLDDARITMISFDKGGVWQKLTPPEKDVFNKKIFCPEGLDECYLHLNSVSSPSFGSLYSTANSRGILIATGNIGEYLTNKPDEVNTYLSRDGGLTWFEIAKGSHIYEIGDHGGLIVIAPTLNATKDVYYSWDEGISWEALRISETPIHVTNIIIEPSNTGEKFIVYGKQANGQKGVVSALDFSSLHQRTCVLPDKPDTPDSDYETWTPNGKISPYCLLGRQTTYVRRKREAKCFNNEAYDKFVSSKPCECTEEDWECDFGYVREGKGKCLPINEHFQNQSMTPPEECVNYYFVTQGYRKVGGDTCRGGVDYEPLRMACPGVGVITSTHYGGFFLLVGIAAIIVWLHNPKNTEGVKRFFDRLRMKSKPSSKKNPEKEGYTKQAPIVAEEENNFTSFVFEDESNDDTPDYSINLQTAGTHKRMTERNAMEAARRHVPLLNRPESKKWIDDIRGC